MDELRWRLRLVYVEGAESQSIKERGRRLTHDELGRGLGRYPGQ
jgi:hypothetical protein